MSPVFRRQTGTWSTAERVRVGGSDVPVRCNFLPTGVCHMPCLDGLRRPWCGPAWYTITIVSGIVRQVCSRWPVLAGYVVCRQFAICNMYGLGLQFELMSLDIECTRVRKTNRVLNGHIYCVLNKDKRAECGLATACVYTVLRLDLNKYRHNATQIKDNNTNQTNIYTYTQ